MRVVHGSIVDEFVLACVLIPALAKAVKVPDKWKEADVPVSCVAEVVRVLEKVEEIGVLVVLSVEVVKVLKKDRDESLISWTSKVAVLLNGDEEAELSEVVMVSRGIGKTLVEDEFDHPESINLVSLMYFSQEA